MKNEETVQLKTYQVAMPDGSLQTVLLPSQERKRTWYDHLNTVSLVVGIAGTCLLAYLTFLQLKKMN